MTQSELSTAIRAKKFGVFLFAGEEDYLIRHYLSQLRQTILADETLAPFNHMILEGKLPDAEALYAAAATPPVFSDFKLVEWHGADFTGVKEDSLTALCELAARASEFPECCIVILTAPDGFDAGALPRRPSRLYKTLSQSLSVVLFERSEERQLAGWLSRHFTHEGISLPPAFTTAMIARCGRSMTTLANEVEKLSAFAKANGKTSLTEDDLALVTVASPEFDTYALSEALYRGDGRAALLALADQKRRRVRPEIVMGSVISAYATLLSVAELSEAGLSAAAIGETLKIHEYRVKRALSAIGKRSAATLRAYLAAARDADLASKSGGAVGYAAVEGLIASLLGGKNA